MVDYHTPIKNHAFIVLNEEAVANLIYDMHCRIINTHQRLINIKIFSEISIKNRETQEVSTIHSIYILQIFYFSIFIHSYLA